jgi:hypothetical protein
MKCVFALFLLACAAYAQNNEPEPDAYSTSLEPEPDMMTTTGAVMNSTTTAAGPRHVLSFSATLANLSQFTSQTDLINQLKAEITKNLDGGAMVTVEIKSLKVTISYGGFAVDVTQPQANNIITAFLLLPNMPAGITTSDIEVNNKTFTSRRLSNMAHVITSVPMTSGDAVVTTNSLHAALVDSASAFTTKLQQQDPNWANFTASITSAPMVQIEVKTTVTGQYAVPPIGAIGGNLGTLLGGTVTVTVDSYGVTSTNAPMEDSAPVAPLMAIWVALYVFLMN